MTIKDIARESGFAVRTKICPHESSRSKIP